MLQQTHDTFAKVTPRQMEIIQQMAEGLSMKEIGQKLGIAWSTVNSQRNKILKRTGCRNGTHVVATFLRNQVIA